jgi:mono/diheme cytochrome c family protein
MIKKLFCCAVFGGLLGAPRGSAQEGARTVWDGIYSEKQAETGRELYVKNCAACHSDTLMGGEQAPPLAGGDFLANWNGLSVGELLERIRTTMPPGRAGKLSRQVNADILAYMFAVNRFPSGKEDMPGQTEILKQIQITMNKP